MKIKKVALFLLLSMIISSTTYADSREVEEKKKIITNNNNKINALQNQKNNLNQKKNTLENDISSILKNIETTGNELDKTSDNIDSITSQINDYHKQIGCLEDAIKQKQNNIDQYSASIDKKEKDIEKEKDYLEKRLKNFYMEQNDNSYLSIVFDSKNISDFLDRITFVQKIVDQDNQTIASIKADKEALEKEMDKLQAEKMNLNNDREMLTKKQDGLVSENNNLISQKASQQSQIYNLTYLEKEKKKKINQLQAQSSSIQGQIEDIMQISEQTQQQIEALISGYNKDSNDDSKNISSSFICPTKGTLTCPFGPRIHPITKVQSFHTGVDIGNVFGTPIKAAADGTVIMAKYYGAYGNAIIISHNKEYSTLYGHMQSFAVSNGDTVKENQIIGYMGSTGMSTGPHLHFEIRDNGQPVNPLNFISIK